MLFVRGVSSGDCQRVKNDLEDPLTAHPGSQNMAELVDDHHPEPGQAEDRGNQGQLYETNCLDRECNTFPA